MTMSAAMRVALELHQTPPALPGSQSEAELPAEMAAERKLRRRLRRTISDGSASEKVAAFRQLFQLPLPSEIRPLEMAEKILHRRLLTEELKEFSDAIDADDMIEQIDGLLDLIYVAYGALLNYGLSPQTIDAAFAEVHASNMTKVDKSGNPVYDGGGKVQKGCNYQPVDLTALIFLGE